MSEEKRLFSQSLERFIDREIEPYYQQWEKDGIIPREVWSAMGEAGILCVDAPAEYGGCAGDFTLSVAVIESLSRRGFAALATNISVHSDIVTPYITHLGTEAQKQYWIPKLVSGEAVGAIAMTEPGAGSDLQGIQSRAVKDGDGWRISGQKTFITNGQHADVCIVAAKTDPNAGAKGTSLFLLDKKSEGYLPGANFDKIGQHAGDTSELFFDQVYTEDLLGELNQGFMHLMQELPRERLILSVGAVAACEGMMKWTQDYVCERKAFGKAISEFQNTRFTLASLDTQLSVVSAFVNQCILQYQQGELTTIDASKAKLSSTELQCKVADECVQLFGGYGYMLEYPIARAFLDARVQRIYGGTSEVMKEIIARAVLGK